MPDFTLTAKQQEAHVSGYDAERIGMGFLDNPYPQDSVNARRWVDGYVQSMQDRLSE